MWGDMGDELGWRVSGTRQRRRVAHSHGIRTGMQPDCTTWRVPLQAGRPPADRKRMNPIPAIPAINKRPDAGSGTGDGMASETQ